MDRETKKELLKWTDSYWDILPPEVKAVILEYKKSQELIDWRESDSSRALCKQLRVYERVRQRWQIGHIQCRPIQCNRDVKCNCMKVYGWFRDSRGGLHRKIGRASCRERV